MFTAGPGLFRNPRSAAARRFPTTSTRPGRRLIRYGVLADSEWAREIGRRMMLMATYDSLPNGVVKDGLLGDSVATGEWSNLAHPWPLCQVLEAIAWLPREFGPNRENHIVRSTSVVNEVLYEKGRISYSTYDAPQGAHEVLRLAFRPTSIEADGRRLTERPDLDANGYTVTPLPNGDCIVTMRHDGRNRIVVEGEDPQQVADDSAFSLQRAPGRAVADAAADGGSLRTSSRGRRRDDLQFHRQPSLPDGRRGAGRRLGGCLR